MSERRRYARSAGLAGGDPDFEAPDPRLVKAVSHPLRQRILDACTERAASPSDLAEEWGESRSGVAYHVRVLHDLGVLELVHEERVRGSVKHYYRSVLRSLFEDHQWEQLPLALRRDIFARTIEMIGEDIAPAARAGGFDEPRAHVSRSLLRLDEEAFAELTALLLDVLRRALELDAESDERRARGGNDTRIDTELAILHFLRNAPGGSRK